MTYLKKFPKELSGVIALARDIAGRRHLSIYLVGGFVRDLFLGLKNWDVDIVVEGDGIAFAEEFACAAKARLIRHSRFKTATAVLPNHLKVDIATARKESYPSLAGLPEVTAGSISDDLFRRDFTINAMALKIGRKGIGGLLDVFGGRGDLKQKKIRVLHDLSFRDDPTRILRGLRFEQRLNFRVEAHTLLLLKEAARSAFLNKVQPQRLRDELILVLKEPRPLKVIRRINELCGFAFVAPALKVDEQTYRLFRSIRSCVESFEESFPRRRRLDTWLIYLMGLTHRLSLAQLKQVCEDFAFRKGETKRLLDFRSREAVLRRQLSKARISRSRLFFLLEPLSYEVVLMLKAEATSRRLRENIDYFFGRLHGVRLQISGADLKMLRLKPGPLYQKFFAQVLRAKLNGRITTKEEEMVFLKRIVGVK